MKSTETRDLPCQLTHQEREARGITLAGVLDDIQKLEDDRKELNKEINSKKLEGGALKNIVRDGYEHRSVECEIERDYVTGKARIYRTDTHALVETRELTYEEKAEGQIDFPWPASKKREPESEGTHDD